MIVSDPVLRANYWEADPWEAFRYVAKPPVLCDTAMLAREYYELEKADNGDTDRIFYRMDAIQRELLRREVKA